MQRRADLMHANMRSFKSCFERGTLFLFPFKKNGFVCTFDLFKDHLFIFQIMDEGCGENVHESCCGHFQHAGSILAATVAS